MGRQNGLKLVGLRFSNRWGAARGSTSSITSIGCLLTGNGIAVKAMPGATVRLSNTDIFNNLTGCADGGGTLASAANNRKGGNVGGTAPITNPNAIINTF